MTLTIEIDNGCSDAWTPDLNFCTNCLEAATELMDIEQAFTISLRFVSSAESQQLNQSYRQKNSATNVLSFPANLPESFATAFDSQPLGDIVICPAVIETEAQQQSKQNLDHWSHMLIHGFLHLLGLDHQSEAEADEMESLEIKCLKKLGINNPYLIG